MTERADFIAIDWGSSRFRAWAMAADGAVLAATESEQGLKSVPDRNFEAVVAAACGDWMRARPGIPLVLSGMVGSRTGWIAAAYAPCPVDPRRLSDGATRFEIAGHPAAILPGATWLSGRGHADVMRGEEVQLLGAAELHRIADALTCIPGTHSKWARVEQRRLTSFQTFITGELFQLLRKQSLIGSLATGDAFDAAAFERGLGHRASMPLSHAVFSARADTLTGSLEPDKLSAYLSGTLIGAELAGRPDAAGAELVLMASGVLADLYEAAFRALGLGFRKVDAKEATIVGLALAARTLWREERVA